MPGETTATTTIEGTQASATPPQIPPQSATPPPQGTPQSPQASPKLQVCKLCGEEMQNNEYFRHMWKEHPDEAAEQRARAQEKRLEKERAARNGDSSVAIEPPPKEKPFHYHPTL